MSNWNRRNILLNGLFLACILIIILRLKFFFSPNETVKFFLFDILISLSVFFHLKKNVVSINWLSALVIFASIFFLISVFFASNISAAILWTLRFSGSAACINFFIQSLKKNHLTEQDFFRIVYVGIVAFVSFFLINNLWFSEEFTEWELNEAPHLQLLYFSSIGTKEYTGQIFSVFLPFMIYITSQTKAVFLKVINVLLIIALIQIMFLSQCRGVMFSLLFSSIITGLLCKKSRKLIFYALAGILLLFGLNYFFQFANIQEFIQKVNNHGTLEQFSGGRINMYLNTIEMIKENPWGIGAGNFEYIHPIYARACTLYASSGVGLKSVLVDPHNIFLKIFSELGIAGGFVFSAIFFLITLFCLKNSRKGEWIDIVVGISWLSLLIHSLFSAVFITPVTLFLSTCVVSLILFRAFKTEKKVLFQVKIPKAAIIVFALITLFFCSSIFISQVFLSYGIRNRDILAYKYSTLINPNNERAWYELALNSFLIEKNYGQALNYIETFLTLYPNHLGGLRIKAELLFTIKEFTECKEIIFQALKICPDLETMKILQSDISKELESQQNNFQERK